MPDTPVQHSMVQKAPTQRLSKGSSPTFSEVGVSGLKQYGGFVVEEWLRQLSGPRAQWVWREMADNDATVGAIIFAIKMLARGVEWTVEEGANPEDAQFVDECRQDMSSTWEDFISEAFTMLIFGWSYHEEVFKRRQGPEGEHASRFDDGKIGWRKLPLRAQETLWRWQFDEAGGVEGLEQMPWDGGIRTVPIEKALLFRTDTTKGNPQGRSMLRNAFTTWYRKKNVEEIEAIGIERDLAGIPTLTPPDGVDLYAPENAAVLRGAEELVTTVRRDEDEGIVLPTGGWKFELVTTGGSRQIDTNEVVNRYKQDIATTVLADMLLVGQDNVGSYAMVDVKADIFGAAVDTCLDAIAAVLNRYAIPRLLKLNGRPLEDPPQFTHGTTRRVDLDAVTQMIERLTLSGAVIFPDDELLTRIFEEAGLPAPAATQTEKAERRAPDVDVPPLGKALLADKEHQELQLSRNMSASLRSFADEAASAYEQIANKASDETASQLATKILAKVGVGTFARKLGRAWFDHYGNVATGVVKSFATTLRDEGRDPEVVIPTAVLTDLRKSGALRVASLSIERQLRDSLERALKEADERVPGSWKEAADRIRATVPAGRFVKAGTAYRSQLIARTETGVAQRSASLAAFEAHPEVIAVKLLDGLLPTSDDICKARNGDVVSFEEAAEISAAEHPNGSLVLLPEFQH